MIPHRRSADPPQGVIAALEEVADRYRNLAGDLREDLAAAGGAEEALELAERSSLEMLEYLPLSPVYSPFCTFHHPGAVDCTGCRYAAKYGRCTEAGSPYDLAIEAHYRLVEAVRAHRWGRGPGRHPITPEEVRRALEDQVDRVEDLASRFQKRVRKARSSEEVMTIKTEFMADLVGELPVEVVCRRCGFSDSHLFEARDEALLRLSRHWPAG
ncbi:hypothetical protein [Candidatus Methanocrinis natronophilus]|uniref:Sigma-70 family RNA polymerase sigma factor n=1 Tax=Candidatus Methanocrinis natronophilus TaxID=3033396 RepID=A0ABT5XA52_9EURY|nr:hypothetical protein [Candidatus Methanocrinis natronophilus]MDF0591566.1 hypothetical protein [Candidatus Methanocrinis natronophilus]